MKLVATYGKTIGLNFKTWLGPFPVIIISNPDDIKILYNHPQALDKSRLTKVIVRTALGDSMLTSKRKFDGFLMDFKAKPLNFLLLLCNLQSFSSSFFFQCKIVTPFDNVLAVKWKKTRQMVVRTFAKSIIESFHQNFVVLSKDLVKRWDKHADNPDQAFDMYDSLARISMEVASSTY